MPLHRTVFSDDWELEGERLVALAIPVSMETVLMDNGGLAVLTQVVDTYSQMVDVRSGAKKPRKIQILYPATMLREIAARFSDAADASEAMMAKRAPGNPPLLGGEAVERESSSKPSL